MNDQQAIIVVDLAFGDSGKGGIVDFLTRTRGAHTIIRFNGGAQAGHNVVTPDGRHHTFSQFGSGLFVPNVRSYLSRHMLIEPYAMFNEEDHLRALGVPDAFARTLIDRRARVITPYQVVANRVRELARGDSAHGTCGMGVGEAVADYLRYGDEVVLSGDLPDTVGLVAKLKRMRERKFAEIEPLLAEMHDHPRLAADLDVFTDESLIYEIVSTYTALAERVRLVDDDALNTLLSESGTVIFEGAQGVLLDERYGFAPNTTWSDTTFNNALALLEGYTGEITRLGVLRTYLTRHGAGVFVTENEALKPYLPEPHNDDSGWAGAFRVGWMDVLAIRYALAACGGVDTLALTHLDALDRLPELRVCTAYAWPDAPDVWFERDQEHIRAIRVPSAPDWDQQQVLSSWLHRCAPQYQPVARADYVSTLETVLDTRIAVKSYGMKALEKHDHRLI